MNGINKVLEQFHKGNLEDAASLAENLLHKNPSNQERIGLLSILGSIHAIQKEFDKAKEKFQIILDIDDTNIDAHYNLAKVLTSMDNNDLALEYYKKILKLKNNHAPSYNNMGAIYQSLNNYEKAIEYFSKAIKLKWDYIIAINNLANVYFLQGDYLNSIKQYQKSLLMESDNPETYIKFGIVLEKSGRLDEAKRCHEQALLIDPKNIAAYNHLGLFYEKIEQYQTAIKQYKKALKLDSQNPNVYTNLGNSYRKMGDYTLAMQHDLKALAINPAHANAHGNLSVSLLKTGDIKNGWEHYEYRNGIDYKYLDSINSSIPDIIKNTPRWNGEPIKTGLLIWPEQGIGDLVMYAKLFTFLPKKKKIIVCLDDRLINLFERSFSKLTFIKQSTYQKDLDSTKSLAFDYQIPIGSLAKLYLPSYNILNNLEDFYLFSDKEKTNSIRKKLKKNNELIIGISWRTTNKESSKKRNIPLSLLAQGLNHEQIKLVNLQYGDVSSEISLLKKNDKISVTQVDSIDIYNDIDSFSSLIDACDLVVSIDNSTVHLAGSLGKKTFVLLPKVSDWRWMLKENFTP